MIGIYKITSPSGKVYIGQSWDIEKRFSFYKNIICKNQVLLYRSFLKYEVNTHVFEIVHELPIDVEQEVFDRYEQLYMDLYRDAGVELMNIREAGSRGKHSNKTINKISISRLGNKYALGHKLTKEHKNKIRKKLIGNKNALGFKRSKNAIKLTAESKKKLVFQYDLNGKFIKKWSSSVEVFKKLKINNLSAALHLDKRKSAGGFIWKFKKT